MSARTSRRDRFEELIAPRLRFVWGAVLLVLFVLQSNLILKSLLVLLYGYMAVVAGKRIRWTYFVVLIVSVTFFNLLTPFGTVLLRIGPFTATEGALLSGLRKGVTIVGLVFVSLFTVSRKLVLPGRFGAFLSRSLYYFERLYAEKKKVRRGHVIEDIDAILERVSEGGSIDRTELESRNQGDSNRRTGTPGVAIVVGVLLVSAGALLAAHAMPWG